MQQRGLNAVRDANDGEGVRMQMSRRGLVAAEVRGGGSRRASARCVSGFGCHAEGREGRAAANFLLPLCCSSTMDEECPHYQCAAVQSA